MLKIKNQEIKRKMKKEKRLLIIFQIHMVIILKLQNSQIMIKTIQKFIKHFIKL